MTENGFRGTLNSATVKMASAVLIGRFLQIDLSPKRLLKRTMTLKISRFVSEPLNCVF